MSDVLKLISSQPSQRLSALSDLYRVLLDRLNHIFRVLLSFATVEVLLNDKSELLNGMETEGFQGMLGDIVVSESDSLLLV